MSLTPEQLEIRRTRIGGSEIGALLGISPHGGPMEVFSAKMLPAETSEPEARLVWGSTVERSILEFHAQAEGLILERPGTLVHPGHSFVCATPDAIGMPNAQALYRDTRVIEAKNVSRWMAGNWGEEEGDDAPFHFLAQLHWNIGVAISRGLAGDIGHLVPALVGEPPRKYEVKFDPELFAGMVEVAAKFVRDHLMTGKAPPASPDATAEYIRRRYAKHDDTLLEPTPELVDLVNVVRDLRKVVKADEAELTAAENALKAAIGEAQGVRDYCTWKLQKRAATVVKESAFRVLRLAPQKEG